MSYGNPWVRTYHRILHRCKTKGNKYHDRGIECFITKDELKILWFRDKADDMDRPSIDRINSDGNYTLNNCRYIELLKNIRLGNLDRIKKFAERTHCTRGHLQTDSVVFFQKDGKRRCRECARENDNKYKIKQALFGGSDGEAS